ncbi:Hsp33 family molecular chaperone HslO [Aliiglaciecola sp. 2_MG-2023]|uniref:Hsp33 family molecular chaperone HslO n=1 Tax=unclassified Aliiglaciecola TaxID=2593648 RepID=UPI0026E2D55A|nr:MULTISPECIES: Hsp33 family molecular chaperone HslO [unclassified Aliiglaciecola]MDO6711115.1 Hsp33 family molecular chaperone HslO [Aliiglaciecola sp. 2_MG-2023]MDO6752029.1 Hsp33 family molecular chaperone HslO [Aliiglaciecola sp. 1_MG-2023]
MSHFDQLHRYVFNNANVRGELVQLENSYQEILNSQQYPPVLQQLLGELMAAASLLTATLKFKGDIALQLQSEGLVKYAVINGTHDQKLRGVARWDSEASELPTSLTELMPKGVLVITITPEVGERYQGMVAIDKPTLSECLEGYFSQSEQLPTKVILKTSHKGEINRAGGLFLQVLPTSSEMTDASEHTDFIHLTTISQTITAEELLGLPATEVLHRLYHQEEVQLYPPQDIKFSCTCSKERSAAAIANVDKQELLNIVAEDGAVRLNCQYCHKEYSFDAIDIEAIHNEGHAQPTQTQ